MKILRDISFVALGFGAAMIAVSFTSVGAQISEGLTRILIANDDRNPIPVHSKEGLRIKGKVEIDGNPKVKLDGDSKIKIKSVDEPVKVRFEKEAAMPDTEIFEKGDEYLITIAGEGPKRCEADKIRGTWIFCKQERKENEIVGWVNTNQIVMVRDL